MKAKLITYPELEGHIIYPDGSILNVERNYFLRPSVKTLYGYKCIQTKGRCFYVHKIVADHFIEGKSECLIHLDGDRGNNCVGNLKYVSMSELRLLHQKKNSNTKSKCFAYTLTDKLNFMSVEELCGYFGVSRSRFYRTVDSIDRINGYLIRYEK